MQQNFINVVCGIIHKNNKFLVARRKHGKTLARYWEFPGGKVQPHETPETALQRELLEELQLPVQHIQFFTENLHQSDTQNILLKAYRCDTQHEPQILIDHDDYQWLSPDEIINLMLAPADIPIADYLLKHY